MQQLAEVTSGFERAFAHPPQWVVKAPGRVNLIGEHTDYNDGFVLPCAIDFATLIAVSKRQDEIIHVVALDYQADIDSFSLVDDITFNHQQMWANYVRGVVAELRRRGYQFSGVSLAISGNVPQGAGLSSSAALEVAVAYAFDQVFQLGINKQDIALIAQAAENNFVGCACGIMDQLISACGQTQMALGIDCRSLALTEVNIPTGMTLLLVNSNVKRGLVDSEYNLRRQQCEQAAAYFKRSHLRDVSIAMFEQEKVALDPIVAKRAEHVIYENQRTLDAMQAFNQGDIQTISQLMAESHQSMQTLFEITTSEIDYLVAIIAEVLGDKGGVRMTGGGFGGCVVALVPESLMPDVIQTIEDNYFAKTGLQASVYITQPAAGVSVV